MVEVTSKSNVFFNKLQEFEQDIYVIQSQLFQPNLNPGWNKID